MKKEILCNAKINLDLKIKGKKDNLHLLETNIYPISIYDTMIIEDSDVFDIKGMENLKVQDNILYKTYMLMYDKAKNPRPIKITMKKEIPIGAGLGGGSSDAANLLIELNNRWNINFDIEKLAKLSKNIGSDVAFFLYNKPSLVTNTGDQIKILDNPLVKQGILIFDNDFCSTKEVYDRIDNLILERQNNQLEQGLEKNVRQKIQNIKNDLLNEGAEVASMSGSGGSVFGIFNDSEKMKKAYDNLKTKYYYVKIFSTL